MNLDLKTSLVAAPVLVHVLIVKVVTGYWVQTEQTREKYISRLKKFLEIIGIDQEQKLTLQERCKIFANKAMSENGWLVT